MNLLASYLIKSIIASGLLYLYYLLALRNKKFHAYNRFYLLLSIIVSLVIPFINFSWIYIHNSPNMPLTDFVNIINPAETNQPVQFFTAASVIVAVSVLVTLLLIIFLASKIRWIYRLKRTNVNTVMQGFTFIETGVKQAPFSFLNNLFWRQGLSLTGTNGAGIFKHELTHIRQKHTYDKLFTQLVGCLFWMNPFYWLIQKELNTIHEFIADAASVNDGDTEAFAKMLLHSYNEGNYLSPAHQFFNSSIKRRLIMISSSNNTRYSYIRRILALPITVFILVALSTGIKAQTGTRQNIQIAKSQQAAIGDTIPQSFTISSKQGPKRYKISGKKPGKNKGPQTITITGVQSNNNISLEPITVSEIHSNQNLNLEPITVSGIKSNTDISLEPITVSGIKSNTDISLEPITVVGIPSGTDKSLEPITISVMPSAKDKSLQPTTVSGMRSNKDKTLKPVTVTGKKLDQEKNLERITVKEKKPE